MAMRGPSSSNARTIVRLEVTDDQRRRKQSRDDQFRLRVDASLAAEMEDVGRTIQVDVDRIVHDVENERWDALEERTRRVVRRVEAVTREAQNWDETNWVESQAEIIASADEDSDIAVAIEWKRNEQESSRRARPSVHPSRVTSQNSSSTCRTNANNQ